MNVLLSPLEYDRTSSGVKDLSTSMWSSPTSRNALDVGPWTKHGTRVFLAHFEPHAREFLE
jgi:hypothetical protein